MEIVDAIARQLSLPSKGVSAVVSLLEDKNTVPFIARYRKEATGSLDEVQIRAIEEHRGYLIELEQRKKTVLAAIEEQGKLTRELRAQIEACPTKSALEDIYLPFKRKRRTRATIARERGLEPLALRILEQPHTGDVETEAAALVDPERGVNSASEALAGAQDIAAEQIAERADVRALVRRAHAEDGILVSRVARGKAKERTKFEQYYDFRESVKKIPSHRYLAIRRGEEEGVLRAQIEVDIDGAVTGIERMVGLATRSPFAPYLAEAIRDGYRRLLAPSVETEVRSQLKLRADREAVEVFADNLRNLLLAAPLGEKPVIGVDPGLRTGCKCAAVDATGRFLGTVTIHLIGDDLSAAHRAFSAFLRKHQPSAIAIGNGTGGRETEAFVREVLRSEGLSDVFAVQVSESGASIYSASETAREEFPDLDLTIRGAISIARRLQDPLAELVKTDPKSIGVGQYQHDVHQPLLVQKLAEVVESCVNHVGVELNTASAPLLAHVAGIGAGLAKKIVVHRETGGAFRSRTELLKVPGLGPRAFEQAAGFLRIRTAKNPLDTSAVHPERYELVERMAGDLGVDLSQIVGNRELISRIDIKRYVGDDIGEPTLRDIVAELDKPGRDPRREFSPPRFRDDVNTLEDLQEGMTLEGVVTNVTAFGAFVDIGVHQDGLVHISQLSDRFVKDPRDVVKVGDKLKVRVLDIDHARRRIALSARSGTAPSPRTAETPRQAGRADAQKRSPKPPPRDKAAKKREFSNNPFAKLRKP